MALSLFWVSSNLEKEYDIYEAMLVCAESEEQARCIHPCTEESNCAMDFFAIGCEDKIFSIDSTGAFYYKERFGNGNLHKEKCTDDSWNESIKDVIVLEISTPNDSWKAGDILMTNYHHG